MSTNPKFTERKLRHPVLPPQPISEITQAVKYFVGSESSADEVYRRVADALASVEDPKVEPEIRALFYEALVRGFIPAGRVNAAAGTNRRTTLMNCYVEPIGDSIGATKDIRRGELRPLIDYAHSVRDRSGSEVASLLIEKMQEILDAAEVRQPGIFYSLMESAETMSRGGGEGYDASTIRPRGALVKGKDSIASGPISYAKVFDAMCDTVSSAGNRRGAQMLVLRIDHPDIEEFVTVKSEQGVLTKFNISVNVLQSFIDALNAGKSFELVHSAEPGDDQKAAGAYQREDGLWVYKTIDPRKLWDTIMWQTYQYSEPGILLLDNANQENNLWYCETLEATNPCGEQPLPPYGCCCLGSVNLTKFVLDPFTDNARFDFDGYRNVVATATRMLDNVLDVTYWPLEEQRQEAMNKRRTGQGFTGLGNTLTMLKLRYDSDEGRAMADSIAKAMMEAAYWASVELAKEKGAFPFFDAEKYLESGFAKRLPQDLRTAIGKHGIRNSHLLSIAPTGTISLAFADNASNGIEPAFSWFYNRLMKGEGDSETTYKVVDHAFRLFCVDTHGIDPAKLGEIGARVTIDGKILDQERYAQRQDFENDVMAALVGALPDYFVSALQMSADDHLRMLAVVQPYVDSSISKTVNVPEDYNFDDFKDLYSKAVDAKLKGLATYRPSDVRGAVLSVEPSQKGDSKAPDLTLDQSDIDRRLTLDRLPEPVMESLRWPKRPKLPNGNPAQTYMVKTDDHSFAVFVGYTQNGTNHPFEVWVNGSEQPRGLGAIAKALSMDMRSADRSWLKAKLDSLERAVGDDGFLLELPPDGTLVQVPSLVSGFAKLVKHCISELEEYPPTYQEGQPGPTDLIGHSMTPMMDALMSRKEPKTDPDGTMSWCADVKNPAFGDDFALFVKELVMPDGQRRPFSVWMSGQYPRVFDGLCKVLSYDMRIIDPAWIGAKLRSLFDFAEPRGDFLARVPGTPKQSNYPSTVAYIARLLAHRYSMLGILDDEAFPVEEVGLMDAEYQNVIKLRADQPPTVDMKGSLCPSCLTYSRIRKDGCLWCSHCGIEGDCS